MENQDIVAGSSRLPDESVPLLTGGDNARPKKKPFYRARPLWLVPFALVAALVRGMTLAPRVEVFMQLSCHRVYGHHNGVQNLHGVIPPAAFSENGTQANLSLHHFLHTNLRTPIYAPEAPPIVHFTGNAYVRGIFDDGGDGVDPNDDTSDPRNLPSTLCISDPDVQAGAAQLQMIMTTTMGLLSAFTTGWWGHFGERHGRTRVLAISTFGLFLTDLVFILVSTPSSTLSRHGHKLLLIAPVIEGALGGWSTLQATTSAYVSDCTSSGSRARIFSRFTGVTYLGVFFGPSISGYLIQHSAPAVGGTKSVTSVFWIAIICSFINFLLALFVFPESLEEERRSRAIAEHDSRKKRGKAPVRNGQNPSVDTETMTRERGFFAGLFSPLAVFLPVRVRDPLRFNKYRRDWSLTLIAVSFFCFMLCVGLYQLKYLYAEHTYGWGAEQLSWYISFLGGMRAISLIVLLPYLIGVFKPKAHGAVSSGKGKCKIQAGTAPENGERPKPTRLQLGREIAFDLMLTRCSFLMDIISNLLIIASPVPSFHHSSAPGVSSRGGRDRGLSSEQSQALFVLASGMASLGTGAAPAINSLTLCILQARELNELEEGGLREAQGDDGNAVSAETAKGGNVGGLFGAFAFLQSIGSMILGPMMFGMIYSNTVAAVPKTIFMVATLVMCVSLTLVMLVSNPVVDVMAGETSYVTPKKAKAGRRKKRWAEVERGRSRVSKDLRGGAAGYDDTETCTGYGSIV